MLIDTDDTYLLIFMRLDHEVELAEAAQNNDPVFRARLMAEQRKSAR